jgi:penicillin V acylase-like amidase (Ntn superfamily)
MAPEKLRWIGGALGLALVFLTSPPGNACTTFVLRDGGQVLFGKNYDWSLGDGLLVANPRGLRRTADVKPGDRAASWTARYGSVTFNQYGVASPSGGVNEAGLAIELMWLDEAVYPAPDERPVVGNLEWIQYQLDNHATVAEVVASDPLVRISDNAPLHYLVADRQGDVAAVEFLGGKMVARRGADLPVPALANDPYASEVASWKEGGHTSRFARAGRRALDFRAPATSQQAVDYAFATLRGVAQGSTQWSIVYDLKRGELHFHTQGTPTVRRLALADVDFTCSSEVRAVSLAASGPDLAPQLRPLTAEEHERFLTDVFRRTSFLAATPADRLEHLATWPLAATCAPAGS